MYYGDYGNYDNRPIDRTKDYPAAKNAPKPANISAAQTEPPLFNFNKSVDAKSNDALGVYGQALMNIGQTGKKNLEFNMALTDDTKAMVGRFVTPEQQARVSENFLAYFA